MALFVNEYPKNDGGYYCLIYTYVELNEANQLMANFKMFETTSMQFDDQTQTWILPDNNHQYKYYGYCTHQEQE